MLKDFRLAQYRFHLLPREPIFLPAYNKGNTLRGAFGSVFKRLSCVDPRACAMACRLKSQCPYGQIFEPAPPEGTERLSKNADIPRPFVIRPPLETTTRYDPEHPLSFDLILIGKAIEYLPYFIVTFRELGNIGIGAKQGRFTLQEISALDLTGQPAGIIYRESDALVRNLPSSFSYKEVSSSIPSSTPARVTLRFLTPTVLKADGQIIQRPEFHQIIKRLRDRVNSLAYFYCDETLEMNHKAFGEKAEQVISSRSDFHWEERSRYSRKQNLEHELSGFVGEGTYEGTLDEFLPLLILGQHVHVGKYAVWGNGWYEIREG